MAVLLHICDAQDIATIIPHLVHEITLGSFQVQTIVSTDPQIILANYIATTPVSVVVIEYPQDIVQIIQQVQSHPDLATARLLIITGRPSQHQELTSDMVYIGDKLDRLPMLRTLLSD